MDVARVREQALEQRQALHVHRRLVAPAALAVPGGVGLVDGADRLPERHPRAETRTHLVEWDGPLANRREPAQVVDERVDVDLPGCRSASCGMKYDSSGTARSGWRSSMTRRSVVPDRRTPSTRSGERSLLRDDEARVVAVARDCRPRACNGPASAGREARAGAGRSRPRRCSSRAGACTAPSARRSRPGRRPALRPSP